MILTTARAARTSCERSATARSLSLFSVLILLAVALPDAAARDRRQCDFDGDGRDDFVVYTSTQSGWYILRSSDGRGQAGYWGGPDAQPVPGDYDGDRVSDLAVYGPALGRWYTQTVSTTMVFWATAWGFTDAQAVTRLRWRPRLRPGGLSFRFRHLVRVCSLQRLGSRLGRTLGLECHPPCSR